MPLVRQPQRDGAFAGWIWHLESPAGLTTLFVLALLLRVLLAPHGGFYADLGFFHDWARRLGVRGFSSFYDGGSDYLYPPGYLYALWLIGKISASPGFVLLKLPAILGDLALAWLAGAFAAALAPRSVRERWPVRGLVAAAVLFNPAVITLSTIWGQVDVLPATLVLGSLFVLLTRRPSFRRDIVACLLFGAAIATKPQGAFALPVVLYALSRGRDHHGFRNAVRRTLRVCVPLTAGLLLWFASGLPFGLSPVGLARFYQDSASVYPVTSANAFNLWALGGFWRPDVPGDTGGDPVTLAGLSALYVGMLLLVIAAAVTLWRTHRQIARGGNEAAILLVTAATFGLLWFALSTRMHERYIFYSLALLAPLIVVRRLLGAFSVLSTVCLLNLWWVLADFNPPGSACRLPRFGCLGADMIFGGTINAWQQKLWAIVVTGLALCLAWFGPGWAAALDDDPARVAASDG